MEKFPESDMIEGTPFINDIGFVTIKLSGKWIAKVFLFFSSPTLL
jgi:hypothetical protein